MLSTNEQQFNSSYSSLIADEQYEYQRTNEDLISKIDYQTSIRLPNIVIFVIKLHKSNQYQMRKTYSIDVPLLSYPFLIDLVNRTFNLQSNFLLRTKTNSLITNNIDLESYLMNRYDDSFYEFFINPYDIDDWCIVEENVDENFQIIDIDTNSIIITMKTNILQQDTLLKRASNWFNESINNLRNHNLTRKEFIQMLDKKTGRLLNEQLFRQRIYNDGCEHSIRKTVWCYLFRIFNPSMTNEDKYQYIIKARQRYDEMKQSWQNKQESDLILLQNLIEKDVTRTDSSLKFFVNKKNLSRGNLLHILMTYCVYHPELGYAQGMTDMAAPILYVIHDEALAYACFCSLMRYMSPLFHSDGIAIKYRLNLLRKTIRAIDIELWNKIEQCDIGNLMFAYRWILLDCKREFPFKDTFRIFETLWSSLPVDCFELHNNSYSDIDDLYPTSICTSRHSSMTSSITNTILSSYSSLAIDEDIYSDNSDYCDEQNRSLFDLNRNYSKENYVTINSNIQLEKWLEHFTSIDYNHDYIHMFTIFLCMALLEQNRSSIMHLSTLNIDNDDYIGCYFARLIRKNDAKQTLILARNYHRQYVLFQMRMKQLLLTNS